ncbi:MAG: pilus assembly protein PilX [Eubacterium sp.]|nr:pilus assembly protein PilX [Eubacterium sp.]
MRKWNGILSAVILVLFLIHGILGGFQLLGAGNIISKALAGVMVLLIGIHVVIGIILTAQTLKIQKQTGAPYFRKNLLFWARRLSGFAIMILLFFHVAAFSDSSAGVFRLIPFGKMRLAAQILLVIAIAVHVISNAKPMLITFGIRGLREKAGDILFVMTVILLFMAAAFIVYYLRWNRVGL